MLDGKTRPQILNYTFINAEVDPVTFIPVVGLFAGTATSEVSQVTVSFNNKGMVQYFQTNKSQATGGPGAGSPR